MSSQNLEQIQLKIWGKVMGALKKDYADEIDFAKAGPLIKELLGS